MDKQIDKHTSHKISRRNKTMKNLNTISTLPLLPLCAYFVKSSKAFQTFSHLTTVTHVHVCMCVLATIRRRSDSIEEWKSMHTQLAGNKHTADIFFLSSYDPRPGTDSSTYWTLFLSSFCQENRFSAFCRRVEILLSFTRCACVCWMPCKMSTNGKRTQRRTTFAVLWNDLVIFGISSSLLFCVVNLLIQREQREWRQRRRRGVSALARK